MVVGGQCPVAAAEPSSASDGGSSSSDGAKSSSDGAKSTSDGAKSPSTTDTKPAPSGTGPSVTGASVTGSATTVEKTTAIAATPKGSKDTRPDDDSTPATSDERESSTTDVEADTVQPDVPAPEPAPVDMVDVDEPAVIPAPKPVDPESNTTPPSSPPVTVHTTPQSIADVPETPRDTTPDAPLATSAVWTMAASTRRGVDDEPAPAPTPAETLITVAALPAADQSLYVGEPTFVARVVELGLRIVDVVLKPFGGLLAFTSLKIPIFTDGVPPFFLTGGLDVRRDEYDGMPVWTLAPQRPTGQYVVALHGGAYTAQASLFHWSTYTDLARDTGATVLVPLYPLISEGGTAGAVVPQTADFLADTITRYGAENVSVLGDSAGAGLAVAAVQTLARRGSPVPARMVLLAPWLDVTTSDPRSASIDPDDPLLDVPSLQGNGRDWAGDLDPSDPLVSPINGSFAGLPPTAVFSGSLDLLTPDSLRLRQIALSQGLTNFSFDFRNGLVHDWPIFGFLPDAIAIRPAIYGALLNRTSDAALA